MRQISIAVFASALWSCHAAPPNLTEEQALEWIRQAKVARELITLDPQFVERAERHGGVLPTTLEDGPVRNGDTVLFGVESFDGTSASRYLLRFEAVDVERGVKPIVVSRPSKDPKKPTTKTVDSRHAAIEVSFLDESGRVLARDASEVPIEFLELGLLAFTAPNRGFSSVASRAVGQGASKIERLALDSRWGFGLFDVLLELIRTNAATRKFAVLSSTWPGLFELPSLIGAPISVRSGIGAARKVPQPIECAPLGSEACRFASDVYSESGPLMEVRFIVVPPIGPLAMTAGVVTASGYRPTEPHRHFVVRLLGIKQAGQPQSEGR